MKGHENKKNIPHSNHRSWPRGKNTGTWVQDIYFLQFYQKNEHLQRI